MKAEARDGKHIMRKLLTNTTIHTSERPTRRSRTACFAEFQGGATAVLTNTRGVPSRKDASSPVARNSIYCGRL